ncbi:hypothetical protein QYE76_017844 [Lolium multiflorum]|uniref:Retrotransposon gag domain-containing protein n=1 Tax=Lolium multiflorum TaxID=4521 RepID=A0AAD8V380_LOLMU|nr:hypothetical protein QYE76_017844 [Lolium multiflorum]
MENYSLFMGAAALMKMAVEMAAVSMEKPPGGVPEQRLLSPRSWLRDGGGSGRFRVPWLIRIEVLDKTLLDTTCSGSFTSNKEEFKRDLLDRIKENAEDWENDKGKESGYADKPPFKPLPPKEGSEEREEEKKKKGTKKKKKKKKKENKEKEAMAYPRVYEVTIGLHERDIFDLFLPEFDKPWTVAIPYTCGSSRLFSGAVAGEHSFIWKFTWIDIVRCKFSIMGKPRDTKIAILPSTTRKGTTLSTSAALDSPSVIDKLVSPPHASRAGTSAESENSHNIDNVSAVLDDSGSLGSFLDATIAKSRQIENTETPNVATPVNSPESVEYSSDDLDEDYVELNDDFIEKCNATTDARKIKKLLAEHAVRYKPSPDPKFATSPINIRDKDYDFSLDLSHIAIVEKTPFCGTEKESAVEHLTELSTLSGVFSDDVKMRTYFVTKIFPFSLKDDAKTWYNNLPPGSIKSPIDLRDVFFRKYFPASAQHAALQRIYNFDQEDGEKLPEAWARFCSLIRAQPDHDLEKNDLLDIFYSGLTIESRAYLDSCAGCVFRKRTPDDAEELLAKIGRNHDDWSTPEPTPTPIVKKRGMIKLNDEDMREAKKSLKEKGIKPEDVKNLPPIEDICETIPPSSMIEDPLYPEGHPKRVEQDSQPIKTSAPSKKKKKKHKNVVESSEPVNDPNSISISDAETESGNEHEEDNDKNDTPDKEEIEKEPEKHAKNKKYTKEDFITEKHGNEREPWVQKQMPFPAKKLKSKEEEHYNKFCDWMKPLFLQIPLTDAIKLPPYSKYMKDIVTNKRKVPNEEISTMLANYSFNGKIPKKLGDPGIPTIPCSIKNNYVRTALCDLGAGVSVMPFSLYKRLDLDKLIPTDISLQMADKSTAIPVGLCENVPVQVTQHCLILTDFVVLEMPEDDNMSIILGRPFLNTAGAVIDCNKGMVTFNVDDKEHTVYFPKRIDKDFKFNWSRSDPMVQYKIYNKAVNLPFGVFCAAIGVPQWGSCEKIRGTPRELSDLYTRICNGRSLSNDDGTGGRSQKMS